MILRYFDRLNTRVGFNPMKKWIFLKLKYNVALSSFNSECPYSGDEKKSVFHTRDEIGLEKC